MLTKILLFTIFIIVVPSLQKSIKTEDHVDDENFDPPHYEFKYGVQDLKTGDHKSQQESRHGDEVKGEYNVVEADGTILKVIYTANSQTGFRAIVTRH